MRKWFSICISVLFEIRLGVSTRVADTFASPHFRLSSHLFWCDYRCWELCWQGSLFLPNMYRNRQHVSHIKNTFRQGQFVATVPSQPGYTQERRCGVTHGFEAEYRSLCFNSYIFALAKRRQSLSAYSHSLHSSNQIIPCQLCNQRYESQVFLAFLFLFFLFDRMKSKSSPQLHQEVKTPWKGEVFFCVQTFIFIMKRKAEWRTIDCSVHTSGLYSVGVNVKQALWQWDQSGRDTQAQSQWAASELDRERRYFLHSIRLRELERGGLSPRDCRLSA